MNEYFYNEMEALHSEARDRWNLANKKGNRFRYGDAVQCMETVAKMEALAGMIRNVSALEEYEKLLLDSAEAFAKDAKEILRDVVPAF